MPNILAQAIRGSGLKPLARRMLWSFEDEVYSESVYAMFDSDSKGSAEVMARTIVSKLRPKSVLDVGCGTGELLVALARFGIEGKGLEYSRAGVRCCRKKGVDVVRVDLKRLGKKVWGRYDLVISLEVGEHLEDKYADGYVNLLCCSGSVVLFSAATPGQGGIHHVNEQPHEYWIKKFERKGFVFDMAVSDLLRREWEQENVAWWYHRNGMVMRRRGYARASLHGEIA